MSRTLTIREVARRAKVSVGTVSNILGGTVRVSPKRRKRVLAAIRQLGYQPNHVARSLKMRRTRALGLVVTDITNPFFSHLVRGAEDAALEHNYLLLTFNTDDRVEREKQVLSMLRARRVDGILLVVAPSQGDTVHLRGLLTAGVPIVCLDRIPPGIKVDSVRVDNVEAARQCIKHLIEFGHRRIGIITGVLALQTAQERLEGYRKALEEAGIEVDLELIREGDFRIEGGYRQARELLSAANRPTALFASNGLMAIGIVDAMCELGLKAPQDVALAAFDDLPVSDSFQPRITTVSQPAYLIGYKGAKLLIDRVENRESRRSYQSIVLPTELKMRESTLSSRGQGTS